MQAVILAGGKGTRISEETQGRPKPLVEAGGQPLLWHIMQNYARFGVTDFVVLVGYKGHQIREYFANYWLHQSDITFDLAAPNLKIHEIRSLPWKVTVVDTGLETQTGGRISRIKDLISGDFLLTYGDGVADVDINELIREHNASGSIATLTAVQPPARFGALDLKGTRVEGFIEKPQGDGGWVNGGYFCLSPKIFDFLGDDLSSFEADTLPIIAEQGKLNSYKHSGYWPPVDTIRALARLEEAISAKRLPWV